MIAIGWTDSNIFLPLSFNLQSFEKEKIDIAR